ncbi:type II secretion system secretin GspD [soil metagenome]
MKKLFSSYLISALAILMGFCSSISDAQVATPPANDRIALQFPNTPIREVLEVYQQLTGKRIIRDPKIEQATVSIETSGELTKADAIIFMEKSLLLAGYAVVPSGENMVKVLAFEGGRKPSSEGVPLFLRAEDLPLTDQVVSFILPLNYLKSDEAAQAFLKIVPIHAGYGDITPVPNARALAITENSNTIRAMIEMAKRLDVSPSETTHQTFQLERADAKEVVEALNTLLGISSTTTGGSGGSAPASRPAQPIQINNNNPQQAAALAAAQVTTSYPQSTEAEAPPPKLQAIERTNSILAIARPIELAYIEKLILELDSASTLKGFISHTLKYLDVSDFLVIAKDALERYQTGDGAGSTPNSGGNPQTTSTTTPAGSNNYSQGGSGFGGGGSGGGGGRGQGGGVVSMQETPVLKPHSIRVGKTLIIAEPSRNELFASGPPEHLRVIKELMEQLDKRPKQIQISVIIGEFTLTKDFRFGLDWISTLQNVGNNNLVGGVLKTTTNAGNALSDINKINGVGDLIKPLQGLTVYGQIGDNLNVFLTALEQSNCFHVIQRPVVVTLNHKAATISTGLDLAIPGQTYTNGSTGNNGIGGNNFNGGVTSTTEYIPVRLSLGVIPHIFNNNEVKLELQQINSDVASYANIGGNEVPNISTQELKNTIIVPNQTTVLLGGLITERDRNDKSGLPWLVRIPVLKHLFGSTTKNKERRELIILVQPHILPDGESQIDAQMDINSQLQSYKMTKEFAEPNNFNPLLPLPVNDAPPTSKTAPNDLDQSPGAAPRMTLKSTKK